MDVMANEISEKFSAILRDLDGSMLTDSKYDFEHKTLSLSFDHWDGRKILLACLETIYSNVSVLDLEEAAEAIRTTINSVIDDVPGYLDKVGYRWKPSSNRLEGFAGPWLHVSIFGDTSVEIVCRDLQFNRSDRKLPS
jgi:hypothetical protein